MFETSGLSAHQMQQMQSLLESYVDVFTKKIGRLKNFQYEFSVKDPNPYFHKTYPVPIKFRDRVDLEIDRMLEKDIIEPSDSEFINPLVIALKNNGDVRVCLDARELNNYLQMDHEGAEAIDELL